MINNSLTFEVNPIQGRGANRETAKPQSYLHFMDTELKCGVVLAWSHALSTDDLISLFEHLSNFLSGYASFNTQCNIYAVSAPCLCLSSCQPLTSAHFSSTFCFHALQMNKAECTVITNREASH